MKDVIAVSALSFILISMGALFSMGFLRIGPEEEPVAAETEVVQSSVYMVQVQAIETQRINLERSKSEMLSLRNDIEIEKRIINDMRGELEGYLQKISLAAGEMDKVHQDRITKLAKLYDSMKAVDAAPIAASLKMDLLVQIVSSMKDKKAAKLLSALPPAVSAEVSRRIGKRPKI